MQAIAAMAAYRDEWPALITCPTSTREAWREAMYDWLGVDDRDVFTVRRVWGVVQWGGV